jgi:hypothetical protein
MTEQEWLACTDWERMLDSLWTGDGFSERKLRLFGCACCRRNWSLLEDHRSRVALERAERFADGEVGKRELMAARKAGRDAWWQRVIVYPDDE